MYTMGTHPLQGGTSSSNMLGRGPTAGTGGLLEMEKREQGRMEPEVQPVVQANLCKVVIIRLLSLLDMDIDKDVDQDEEHQNENNVVLEDLEVQLLAE